MHPGFTAIVILTLTVGMPSMLDAMCKDYEKTAKEITAAG